MWYFHLRVNIKSIVLLPFWLSAVASETPSLCFQVPRNARSLCVLFLHKTQGQVRQKKFIGIFASAHPDPNIILQQINPHMISVSSYPTKQAVQVGLDVLSLTQNHDGKAPPGSHILH